MVRPYSEYRATKTTPTVECSQTGNFSAPDESPLSAEAEQESEEEGQPSLPANVSPLAEVSDGEDSESPSVDPLLGLSVASIPSRSHVTCLARELFLNFDDVSAPSIAEEPESQRQAGPSSASHGATAKAFVEPSIGEVLSPVSAFDPFAKSPARSGTASGRSSVSSLSMSRHQSSNAAPLTLADLASSGSLVNQTSGASSATPDDDGLDDFSALARERTQQAAQTSAQDPWSAGSQSSLGNGRLLTSSLSASQVGVVQRHGSPSVARSAASADGGGTVHPPAVSSAPHFSPSRHHSSASLDPMSQRPPMPTPFDELVGPDKPHAPTHDSSIGTDPFSADRLARRPGPPIKPYTRRSTGSRVQSSTGQLGLEFDPLGNV